MATVISKVTSISELDQLVSDYQAFRKFNDASELISIRKDLGSSKSAGRFAISSKILTAFDHGDYACILSLWETYIIQSLNETLCSTLTRESKDTEFLCNLHCAVYPFRPEVIRRVGKTIPSTFIEKLMISVIIRLDYLRTNFYSYEVANLFSRLFHLTCYFTLCMN